MLAGAGAPAPLRNPLLTANAPKDKLRC